MKQALLTKIYNLFNNTGFVNIGSSHDTSEFTVHSISRWWETVSKDTFPNHSRIYTTCNSGGRNGYRWKYLLQEFSNHVGLEVEVSHFPNGTSKWNKVEHRLFYYISANCKGLPLVDVQITVYLIGSTKTTTSLKVVCVRDDTEYELAEKVSDEDFESISIDKMPLFGAWNYRLSPI